MERDGTGGAPKRRRLRVETGEERLLAAIIAAGLVFLVFSVVQAAVRTGSHGSRARAQAAAARQAPLTTTTSTPAPAPPAASAPTTAAAGPPRTAASVSASSPVLHMLAVRTEPRVPDASFSFAGTTFTTDPRSGVALLLISGEEHDRLVTDPAHELTVTTPAVPLWRGRAVFTGWAGQVRPDGSLDTAVATFHVAA